jgi:3-oxoacyl-[acyl-carrier-protein] synthase II
VPNPDASPIPEHSLIEVVVTAMGVVSPLGRNCQEALISLRAGRDCATAMTRFDVSKCRCHMAAQIPDEWLKGCLKTKQERTRLHRASRMTIMAMQELVSEDPGFQPELTIVGTTSGGMSFGEDFFRAVLHGAETKRAPSLLSNYSPQKMVHDALSSAGFRVPSMIIANACASGSNAVGHGFNLIRKGKYQRVICGGYDAISELVFVGFDSLQASTPGKCSPFDKDRTGLVLGEGAAWLALESRESAETRGAQILGKVTGYGISTDNFHLTQPHPSGIGPRLAMERALASAGRKTVDYINAHGTATTFNDATEGLAISEMFGERVPVSSTKSMMGHSLGAAGAIEAVIALMALREQFLPPNINFIQPDLPLNIVANQSRPAALQSVLSNSFGFGGTNASLVLERA